jgi:hypothetical protein
MVNSFRSTTYGGAIGAGDVTYSSTKQAQQFRTYPIPNYNLALYQLQIRDSSGALQDSYIFPLSPESYRKEYSGLTNYYDVQGDNSNAGVLRVIDSYGLTPPTIILEGTTGWKLHQSDGYQYTGLQSISRIEAFLVSYINKNQTQIAAGNQNLFELWFFDFFRNEYWIVEPIGPQGIRQSSARPLYVSFSFRFVSRGAVPSSQIALPDNILQLLSASSTTGAQNFQSFASSFTTAYSGVTAPAK